MASLALEMRATVRNSELTAIWQPISPFRAFPGLFARP